MQGLAITTDHRVSLALRIQSSCLKKHLKPTRVCFSNFGGSFPNSRLLLSGSSSSQKPIVPLSVTSSPSSSPSRVDRLAEISIVLENLSPKVRKRVEVLIEIEKQYEEMKAKFVEERSALDAKYHKLYQPLLTKRCKIVDGRGGGGGVCCFWLNVLMNNDVTGKDMTVQDLGTLGYLNDIKWSNIIEEESIKGFKLEFYFGKNIYFKNTVLTKEYYIKDEYFRFDIWKIDGTKIKWYPGMEDFENFFSFFSPALYGRTSFSNKEKEEKLYYDFRIAKTIKNEIIPRAVSWFSDPDLRRKEVKNVEFLNEIQKKYDELEAKYMEERAALEAKYHKLYQPLFTKRYEIVNGVFEVEVAREEDKSEKGVPDFWLRVLKSSCSQIKKRDEGALKYLKDIKWSRIEEPPNWCSMPEEASNWIEIDEFFPEKPNWIKIEFFFDHNPYFKNTVLTKIYHILDGSFNFAVNKAIGTNIEWYPGNCLTTMRSETDEEFVSFFNFFSLASPHKEDCFAEEYKHEIIPHAVSLFLEDVKKSFRLKKLKSRLENV